MKMQNIEEIDITLRLIAYYRDREYSESVEIVNEATEKRIFFEQRLKVLTSYVMVLEK